MKGVEQVSDQPLTWDNIPGLTDEERAAGRKFLEIHDLRAVTLEGNVVDGVTLPPIVNGVVVR